MHKRLDLANQKFNRLTVVGLSYIRKSREAVWECKCDCGNTSKVRGSELKNGRTKSCGCFQKEMMSNREPYNFKDLTGHRFGRFMVLNKIESSESNTKWSCLCDCGVVKHISRGNLISGQIKSCGCLNKEIAAKTKTTHGLSKHPLYSVWSCMLSRCYNINVEHYYCYGGRGIYVSDEWRHDFMKFYEDVKHSYKKGLQLDRVDVNGNYCKENCRWATSKENSRNKRNNLYLTIDGEKKLAVEWAEDTGAAYHTIHNRRSKGFNDKQAVFGKTRYFVERMSIYNK